MPEKHKRQRGGLTKAGPVDYTDLREREAPKGKFRVIIRTDQGFEHHGDYNTFHFAKLQAVKVIKAPDVLTAYVHSESNRVLHTEQ